MRELLPGPVREVEPYDAFRPEQPDVPLLRLNMVQALDGRAADIEHVSASLGGRGDFAVFVALRALADAIMVGAGTARAEDYGPHRVRPSLAIRRRADGRTAPAPIVVVTRSGALDPSARLFREARTRPIVLACRATPPERLTALRRVATVVVRGNEEVDLAAALAHLRDEHGLAHVLCEGGPVLNAHLVTAGLVDELCCTISPQLAGGDGPGIVTGLTARVDLELASLYSDGLELFTRYRVRPPRGALAPSPTR